MAIINKDANTLVKHHTSVDGFNTAVRQLQQALLDGTFTVRNAEQVNLTYLATIFQKQGTINLLRNSEFSVRNDQLQHWSSINATLSVIDTTINVLATSPSVSITGDLAYHNMTFGLAYTIRMTIRASRPLAVYVYITDTTYRTNNLIGGNVIDTHWQILTGTVDQLFDITNTYNINDRLPINSQLIIHIPDMQPQDWIEIQRPALYEGQLPLAWQRSLFDEVDIDEHILLEKLKIIDGHSSGLDADTVDGKHAADFALVTLENVSSNQILNKLKTIDGHSSGLDADTVDGKHAADFADKNHNHNLSTLTDVDASEREDKRMLVWNDELHKHVYVEIPGASNELTNISSEFILEKLKTIDGHGSGLDADTVDGKHAADFALVTHNHALSALSDVDDSNRADNRVLTWKESLNTHVYTDPAELNTVALSAKFATCDLSNVQQSDLVHKLEDTSISGLDADTVDGKHAADFADKNHNHNLSLLADVSNANQSHHTILVWNNQLQTHLYIPYFDYCTLKLPVRQYVSPYNNQFTLVNFSYNKTEYSNPNYVYSDTALKATRTGLYYVSATVTYVGQEGLGQRAARILVDDQFSGIGHTTSSLDHLPVTLTLSGVIPLETGQTISLAVTHTATENIYIDTSTSLTLIFLRNYT